MEQPTSVDDNEGVRGRRERKREGEKEREGKRKLEKRPGPPDSFYSACLFPPSRSYLLKFLALPSKHQGFVTKNSQHEPLGGISR